MVSSKICPICKSRCIRSFKVSRKYNYCSNCITAWREMTPVAYKNNYYSGKYNVAYTVFKPFESIFYIFRRLYVGLARKNVWLDIGAGEGYFLSKVNAKEKIGVEISQAGRELMARKNIKAISEKDFLKMTNLNADVISFWHVLEHVDNPLAYLYAARKNLSKNGKVVIGVPNIDSYEFQLFKKYWFHLAPMFHVWHFSTKSMQILLDQSGLRAVSKDYFAIEHHLSGVLQTFINYSSGSINVLHGILKRSAGGTTVTIRSIFWIMFWLTLGLPLVLLFWIIMSFTKKSGAFVLVAQSK